eukprot:scaffold818_cov64-Phaeocystis_antarctica.AAC.9
MTAMQHFDVRERASDRAPKPRHTTCHLNQHRAHRGDLTTRHEPWRAENLQWACACHSEHHLLGQGFVYM